MDHRSSARAEWLARQYGVPAVDLSRLKVSDEVLTRIPGSFALQNLVVPLSVAGEYLVVAFADPADLGLMDQLAALAGMKIEPAVADAEQLRAFILRRYGFA